MEKKLLLCVQNLFREYHPVRPALVILQWKTIELTIDITFKLFCLKITIFMLVYDLRFAVKCKTELTTKTLPGCN